MREWLRSAVSGVLSRAKRPLGRYRFRRAVNTKTSPLRIELGAWTTERPGWISTDVHWRGRTYLDGTRAWPIPDESVEFIYADNVIEHLSLEQNRYLLAEAHRVLRPGGRIRLVTPDIGALVQTYLADEEHARPLREELAAEGYLVAHQVDVLRFAFQDDGHSQGYLWDEVSLSTELVKAGFSHWCTYVAGVSDEPDLCGLESRTGTPVADICIVMEAEKAQ